MPELTEAQRSKLSVLLSAIGDGQLEKDISDEVGAVALRLHHLAGEKGKASAVLTIKVKLTADRGVFDADADFSIKEPKKALARTILHINPRDGSLSRNNVNQMEAFASKQPSLVDERPIRALSIATGDSK